MSVPASKVGALHDSRKSSKLTCSLSLLVEVRLIVKAWLNPGAVPAVAAIPQELFPAPGLLPLDKLG